MTFRSATALALSLAALPLQVAARLLRGDAVAPVVVNPYDDLR